MTLNGSDRLKLEVLFQAIERETEYCLSFDYNSNKNWSFEQRVLALINVITDYASKKPSEIISIYGSETFSKYIQEQFKMDV